MVKKSAMPDRPKPVTLYVEGGGDSNLLRSTCREGFSSFLSKAGLTGHLPRIVACGGRENAFDSFCTAIANGERAFLLVDSEAPVLPQSGAPNSSTQQREQWQPWAHLKQRIGDEWERPHNATDTNCHLMVQIMENWFLADPATLAAFFGAGFNLKKLPNPANSIESIAKPVVYKALSDATANCKTKARYGKGEHSFKLLAAIDPARVCAASPWAQRFVDIMKKEMAV